MKTAAASSTSSTATTKHVRIAGGKPKSKKTTKMPKSPKLGGLKKKPTRKFVATHFTRTQIRDGIYRLIKNGTVETFGGVNKLNKQQLLEHINTALTGNLVNEVVAHMKQAESVSSIPLNELQKHHKELLDAHPVKLIRLAAKDLGVKVQYSNTMQKNEYVTKLVITGRGGDIASHIGSKAPAPTTPAAAAPAASEPTTA
ncbi:Hypothetical protein UVM_LOCUS451 [uncultured virus]|nr:Hypothetical protein UVM_LOCUS451 [uncultured virus]